MVQSSNGSIKFEQFNGTIFKGEPIESVDKAFTVSDALNAYFKHKEQRGMKGVVMARCNAMAHIIPAFGDVEVSKLTKNKIENWLYELANTPKRLRTKAGKPQVYAPPPHTEDERRARRDTANRILGILKAALNHAIDETLITLTDPTWHKVKAFRDTTRARLRFLQPTEAARLVNACPPDFKNLVKGALMTGARYGELCRLQTKDFNPNSNITTLFIAESKSGKPRHIILTPEGTALFEELTIGKHPNDPIFTHWLSINRSRTCGRFDGKNDQRILSTWKLSQSHYYMQNACKMAGLDYISFHELRHTYASMLVNAGCPLVYVAKQLGHADISMVQKHYGHLAPSDMAVAILAAMPILGIVEPSRVKKFKIKGV